MIWSSVKTNWYSLLIVIFTASIAYFAYRQHRLEKSRFKLEAYERRLKIRDVIHSFISDIEIEGTSDSEHQIALRRETKHAKFLFDKKDDIISYIDSLYDRGLYLEYKQKYVERERESLSKEQREKMGDEISEIKRWFTKQHAITDSKFEKYLQL